MGNAKLPLERFMALIRLTWTVVARVALMPAAAVRPRGASLAAAPVPITVKM